MTDAHSDIPQTTLRRRAALYTLATAWTGLAGGAIAVWFITGAWRATDWWLFTILAIATVVLGSIQFTLTTRGRPIIFSPDHQALVLAAIFLPPEAAALIAATLMVDFMDPTGTPVHRMMFCAGASMNAVLAAGIVTHQLFGDSPSSTELLAAALVASVVFELVNTLLYGIIFAAREIGRGRRFLVSYRSVGAMSVALTTVVVVLVGPFADSPLVLALVFASFQIVTYLASRLSTSETVQRQKNAHLQDVFGRYVPTHVAEQLVESGQDIQLGGEGREITVLFVDVRGFTSWSENATPEVVITELNGLLGGLSGAVMQADGTLDKYTGDGLMAFWGAPLEQPDHAERAWSAAVDMLMRLREFNRGRVEAGEPPFAIGIGIHSGEAVVGNIGHEQRLDYTAIGDTVNTAARLESATKDLGSALVISGATHALLPPDKRRMCEHAGDISVKGRTKLVPVYRLPDGLLAADVEAA